MLLEKIKVNALCYYSIFFSMRYYELQHVFFTRTMLIWGNTYLCLCCHLTDAYRYYVRRCSLDKYGLWDGTWPINLSL